MKLEKSLGDSKFIINKNCFQEQLISSKDIYKGVKVEEYFANFLFLFLFEFLLNGLLYRILLQLNL